MTQENKELLLKDLCARLPFKVKVEAKGLIKTIANEYDDKDIINAHVLNGLNLRDYWKTYSIDCIQNIPLFNRKGVCNIKPYLFPLSSMTDDMMEELNANGFFKYRDTITNVSHLESKNGISEEIYTYIDIECISFLIEYFHSHHIDYRCLIEKGLAIDATGKGIY